MGRFVFKYPDGTVANLDEFPNPSLKNPSYKGKLWKFNRKNSVGMNEYVLSDSPVSIKLVSDDYAIECSSDSLAGLTPPIPEKSGYNRIWVLPEILYDGAIAKPGYEPILYHATFHDDRLEPIVVTFSVEKKLVFPSPMKRKGFYAKWSLGNVVPLSDIDVYAEYKPLKITFRYNGHDEQQMLSDYSLPKVECPDGYDFEWIIPDYPDEDIVVKPIIKPKILTVTFHFSDHEQKEEYVYGHFPQLPLIPMKSGYHQKWSEFDPNALSDQVLYIEEEPINMTLHFPDGHIDVQKYADENGTLNPILSDYDVFEEIGDDDIDVKLTPKVKFALFYSCEHLVYCVPYTIFDHHYVDEVIEKRTVPKSKRMEGKWVKAENLPFEEECYVADYSENKPQKPEPIECIWGLNEIVENIQDDAYYITLGKRSLNLLETTYGTYTGITKNNYKNRKNRKLCDWLHYNKICYENKIKGTYISGKKLRINGYFAIGYDPRFKEALDFLEENEIYFVKPKKSSKKINGLPVFYLKSDIIFDSGDDFDQLVDELVPLNKMIPPLGNLKTIYSQLVLKREKGRKTSKEDRDQTERGNQIVISIFNSSYNPEYKYEVTDKTDKNVIVEKYLGNEPVCEVPSVVRLEENGTDMYTVVEIGSCSFQNNMSIQKLVLPESISHIGGYAFAYCENLKKIVLKNASISIDDEAFFNCTNLRQVDIPDSAIIGNNVFPEWCKVTIMNEENKVGQYEKIDDFVKSLIECEYERLVELLYGFDSNHSESDETLSKIDNKINEKALDIFNLEIIVNGQIDERFASYLNNKISRPSNDEKAKDRLDVYLESLSEAELDYLKLILFNDNCNCVSRNKVSINLIICSLNEKASDILDDDEGIINNDGVLCEDYIDLLKERLRR